tara:strand:- start:677 stop:928 length:252 start_codon:yes stop_codon:yes gene_type:complete
MKFFAKINIMPQKALLDPQGKAVTSSMVNIGCSEITNVRIGKHITLEVNATSEEEAKNKINTACKELLCNQIMEEYNFDIIEA